MNAIKEFFQKYEFKSPDHFSILRLVLLYVLPIITFFTVGNLLVVVHDLESLISFLPVALLESFFGFMVLYVPVGIFAISVELMAISKKVKNGAFFVFVSGFIGMVTFVFGISYHDGANPIQIIIQESWFIPIMFTLHGFVSLVIYRKRFYRSATSEQ